MDSDTVTTETLNATLNDVVQPAVPAPTAAVVTGPEPPAEADEAENAMRHRLLFVRHGLAGEREDWDGPDEERPLTSKGRKRLKASRFGYRAALGTPTAILASPYVRAKDTAAALAKFVSFDGAVELEPALGHGGDAAELDRILRGRAHAREIVLVGHSPDLERWISRLVCGDPEAPVLDLKKGGVARVDVEAVEPVARGKLRWILTPGLLRDLDE